MRKFISSFTSALYLTIF